MGRKTKFILQGLFNLTGKCCQYSVLSSHPVFGLVFHLYPGAVAPTCFERISVGVNSPSQRHEASDISISMIQTITTPAAPPNLSQVAGLVAAHVVMLNVTLSWASGGGSSSYYRLSYGQGGVAPRCSSD